MSTYAYLRVSTQKQARDDKTGYQRQKDEIDAYCKAHDLHPERYFRDATSGTKEKRDALDALFETVRAGDIVVFPSINRLSRRMSVGYRIVEDLQEIGVHPHTAKGGEVDLSTQSGTMRFGVDTTFAQAERQLFHERTQAGLRVRAERGLLPNGISTMGYKTDHEGGAIVIPEQAATIRRIYELRNAGHSFNAIAVRLNEDSVPVARPQQAKDGDGLWYPSTIRDMIRNRTYKGEHVCHRGDKEYVIRVPAIVSEDEWTAAQPRNGGAAAPSGWPLVSHIQCGVCGTRMSARTSRRHGSTYEYYRCQANDHKNPHKRCKARLIPRAPLEAAVEQAIAQRFTDPDVVREMLGVAEDDGSNDEAREALLARRERVVNTYIDEIITRDELKTRTHEIDSQLKALGSASKTQADVDQLVDAAARLPLRTFLQCAGIVVVATKDHVSLRIEEST